MGAILFSPGDLADSLSETAGYKSGLALNVEAICDHLSGTSYPDTVARSETTTVRIRSEEYDALFYKLLYRIGYSEVDFDGDATGACLWHKYKRRHRELYTVVCEELADALDSMFEKAEKENAKSLDPSEFLLHVGAKHGPVALKIVLEKLKIMNFAIHNSPRSRVRYYEWQSPESLQSLFSRSEASPEIGRFIDQRFVDYLSNNTSVLPTINWRRFEQLSAEFFSRAGYRVELGPGTNDDGVDIRVWLESDLEGRNPLCVIQCKREAKKVNKVTVKGLYADVVHEKAECGVIITTSELSPGARATISARGYPIIDVDKTNLPIWLKALRTPGSGIVRV